MVTLCLCFKLSKFDVFKLHCVESELFTSSSNRSMVDQRSAKSLLHTSHYYIVDRNVDDFHEEANEAHHKES